MPAYNAECNCAYHMAQHEHGMSTHLSYSCSAKVHSNEMLLSVTLASELGQCTEVNGLTAGFVHDVSMDCMCRGAVECAQVQEAASAREPDSNE